MFRLGTLEVPEALELFERIGPVSGEAVTHVRKTGQKQITRHENPLRGEVGDDVTCEASSEERPLWATTCFTDQPTI